MLIQAIFVPSLELNIMHALRPFIYLFIFSVFLFCVTKEDTETILDFFNKIFFMLSILNIPLIIFDRFLIWEKVYMRSQAIFYHPNIAGLCFGFSFLYTVFNKDSFQSKYVRYVAIATSFVGIVFSFSRGAIISVILAVLLIMIKKRKKLFTFLLLPIALVLIVFSQNLFNFISNIFPLYHLSVGFNERSDMWLLAIKEVLKNPFLTHTQDDLRNAIIGLLPGGYNSFHNAYLDTTYLLGLPFVIIIVLIIGLSFFKNLKEKYLFAAILLHYIINTNVRSVDIGFSPFIPGALGMSPFIMTLLILYPFQSSKQKLTR
jgi:hypothetical protein